MSALANDLASFRTTSGVYALVDPRSSRIMYIGQSIDIDYRYRQHLNPNVYDGHPEKHSWIAGLRAEGLKPRLVILAECELPEVDAVEADLIRQYRVSGQCELNRSPGGQLSRTKGHHLKNARKDDWYQLGRQLKAAREILMEVFRETIRVAGAKDAEAIQHAMVKLDSAKARLLGKLSREFPEWSDVSHVFYGPDDPKEG